MQLEVQLEAREVGVMDPCENRTSRRKQPGQSPGDTGGIEPLDQVQLVRSRNCFRTVADA